jgi:hypothetical protein
MKSSHAQLTDHDLLNQTVVAAKYEKAATLALLEYLCEVDSRKAYATLALSSLFEYIVKELGFSESQASERVSAVRLMRQTPGVKVHLESGKLNLSTAAKIQRFVQTEKKLATALKTEEKLDLIQECLGKSKRSVDHILFQHASEPTQVAMKERVTLVGEDQVKLTVTLDLKTEAKLKRARELIRTETVSELLGKALDALIEQQEKKMGKVEASPKTASRTPPAALAKATQSRYIPREFKNIVYERSGGRCEFTDQKTKIRCESRAYLEMDHIVPLARNGNTEITNLRYLCRNHNVRSAVNWGISMHEGSES